MLKKKEGTKKIGYRMRRIQHTTWWSPCIRYTGDTVQCTESASALALLQASECALVLTAGVDVVGALVDPAASIRSFLDLVSARAGVVCVTGTHGRRRFIIGLLLD